MSWWILAACGGEELVCGAGTHEEGGACVPDDVGEPVGNDVRLDSYPPVVVATTPVNGDAAVDAALDAISVTFSQDMTDGSWSWVQANQDFPEAGDAAYTDARTNVLAGVQLEAGGAYVVWVNDPFHVYEGFVGRDGQPALPYPISFAVGGDAGLLADMPAAVVGTDPPCGAADVSPDEDHIEVFFGKDMDDGEEPAWIMDDRETWPDVIDRGWKDERTAWLEVALEPDTTYAIWVGREEEEGFFDLDGIQAMPYLLTFRTASE
jgi:hypothetical protein